MKKLINSLPCWGRWHGKAVTDEVSSSNEKTNTDLIHRKGGFLAAARSQNGSGVINTIHYRSAASLPSPTRYTGEGSRSRSGFTLVEVVVALVIIVLVSGISIGVVTVNNKAHAETIDMIEATNIAENAIECFRFAVENTKLSKNDGESDDVFNARYETSLKTAFKTNFEKTGSTLVETAVNSNTYTVTDGRVVVSISLNFDDNSITITATNGGTNALIETKTYTVR